MVRFPYDKARRRCATAATRLGFECQLAEPMDDMPFPLLLERVCETQPVKETET